MQRRRFVRYLLLSSAGVWLSNLQGARHMLVRELSAQKLEPLPLPRFTPDPGKWSSNQITAAWLGHSTVLINFFGATILTDPALFPRIGADLRFTTVGLKRLVAPALDIRALPPIDLVLLSHAHFDHFDLPTLRALPHNPQVITARATADLLERTRLKKRTHELIWGQSTWVKTHAGNLRVEAFRVNHWGARWRNDRFRGYNGYLVEREGRKILFGGDTAYCEFFREVRPKGPFDLAIMPIGAYNPKHQNHCTPEEAVAMANDAGAHHLLPVHHRTFHLSREAQEEPIQRLTVALEDERLAWREVGETFRMS
jgi:L-ascorbate metabolism protein UlaG (beta-lactamase superfamily)